MEFLEQEIQQETQRFMEEAEEYVGAIVPSFSEVTGIYFSCADISQLKRKIDAIRNTEIHYYRDLTSYNPRFTAIVIFVKRVIRKLVRFIGEPMANEAMVVKYHTEDALDTIYDELVHLQRQSRRYDEMLSEYERKLTQLQQKNAELEQMICALKSSSEVTV